MQFHERNDFSPLISEILQLFVSEVYQLCLDLFNLCATHLGDCQEPVESFVPIRYSWPEKPCDFLREGSKLVFTSCN